MSAIPNLKIPITVQTDQIAPAMRKAEREVAASAQRMSRIRAAMQPALGVAGAGPLGALAGGLGAAGLGGAAIAVGAAVLPFAGAARALDTLESTTKGANAALEEFRKTGRQTFSGNVAMLQRLAEIEAQMKPRTTFGQAFGAAAAGANMDTLQRGARVWNAIGAGLGTLLSAATGGGESISELVSQVELQLASNENEARRAYANLVFDQRRRVEAQQRGEGIGLVDIYNRYGFGKINSAVQEMARGMR